MKISRLAPVLVLLLAFVATACGAQPGSNLTKVKFQLQWVAQS